MMKFRFVDGKTYKCEVITPPRGTFAIAKSGKWSMIHFPVAILFINKRRLRNNSNDVVPMGFVNEYSNAWQSQYVGACLDDEWCDEWLKSIDDYFRWKYGKKHIYRVMLPLGLRQWLSRLETRLNIITPD